LAGAGPVTETLDLDAVKAELRARMRGLRRHLAESASVLGAQAAQRVPVELLTRIRMLAGYWPISGEIDPRALMTRAVGLGARLALPAALGRDSALVFRAYEPDTHLTLDALSVPAPGPMTEARRPDAIIAPLLAFDRRGGRLGQGGGHYDRTLALPALQECLVIGMAYSGQEVSAAPMQAHDRRLHYVVTEAEWIECR